jgi:hypothetical protein
MRRLFVRSVVLAAATVAGSVGVANAGELTDVASSFDDDNPFDLRLRVGYQYSQRTGSIKREGEGPGQDEVIVYKDLLYRQVRHAMSVRAEIGVFQDLAIFAELPFVLQDDREYRFDQSEGSNCIYPGQQMMGQLPTCVNASNSTTINDGIVPPNGFDAPNSMAGVPVGFTSGTDLVFRGISRGGGGMNALDTINLGINWGIFSQKRDDTKPNWLLGIEADISFGNVMSFDRNRPDASHGISEGVHRLFARTSISHRFKYVEPYVGFWYMYPIARGDSLFIDYGTTQKFKDPQQEAGTIFGIEAIPWENKEKQYKVALDLRGRIEGKFTGRGYSEAWELFASSPALACDPKWNPACDPSKNNENPNSGYQGKPFTGLTTIDNYASLGGDVALVVQAGKYVHFNMGLSYNRDQSHNITIDDVGRAWDSTKADPCSVPIGGRVSRPCEFNPAYRPVINEVGRRYKVDGMDIFKFGIWGQAMF